IKDREIYKIMALPVTMQPGDTLEFEFVSSIVNTRFHNSGYGRELIYNGTFIGQCLPNIGYSSDDELSSDEKRRKYGLPEKDADYPPHDDPYGRRTLLFSPDADFIQFEALLSTDSNQIAMHRATYKKNGYRVTVAIFIIYRTPQFSYSMVLCRLSMKCIRII
ncbi:MAG: hypothetical protein M3421_09910, partial [Bacteroidota bacterium]|nr:hypothetical protein [Bacteroidota bacterium]